MHPNLFITLTFEPINVPNFKLLCASMIFFLNEIKAKTLV